MTGWVIAWLISDEHQVEHARRYRTTRPEGRQVHLLALLDVDAEGEVVNHRVVTSLVQEGDRTSILVDEELANSTGHAGNDVLGVEPGLHSVVLDVAELGHDVNVGPVMAGLVTRSERRDGRARDGIDGSQDQRDGGFEEHGE